MSTILSAPTNPQLEGIVRSTLTKRILMKTGLGAYGTATGGSTSDIQDTTRLKSTQYNTKQWVGGWARISKDAGGAGAAPEGEISPITEYEPASLGKVTFNPIMTAAVASSDLYELWTNPNPQQVLDIIDVVLTESLYMPCWTLLTEVPDGDMEQSNTTDWTASNVTHTKITTTEPVMYGKRFSKVLTTAANGYIRSALLYGEPSKQYHVSAMVRCGAASTTAKLIAYDETNSAEIDSITSTRLFNHRLVLKITLPATCYTWSVRLSNVEDAVTTYWDEVCAYPYGATEIRLPWWLKQKNQKLGIFKLSPQIIDSDVWDAGLRGEEDKTWYIQDKFGGGGQLRIQQRDGLGGSGLTDPLFIYGLRNEEAYSSDNADEKFIDSNLLVAWCCWQIFEHLATRPVSGQQNIGWILAQRDRFQKEALQLQYQQMEDIHRIMGNTPTPDTYINDEFSTIRYD